MTDPSALGRALVAIQARIGDEAKLFALVGGLAVSARAEPRFTRVVDLAVGVRDDAEAEALIYSLTRVGYHTLATVEHETLRRLATVRMRSPEGPVVDLLFASSGIEHETVTRASALSVPSVGVVNVARAEELVAMKVLSMRRGRPQDAIDALRLLEIADLDLAAVRQNLSLITERGFHRRQDLEAKLQQVLEDLRDIED